MTLNACPESLRDVQHGEPTRLCAEPLRVGTKLLNSGIGSEEQNPIQGFHIVKKQWVELMGHSKNHMGMRHRQHIGACFINPQFFFNGLTNRTIAIATGVKNVKRMPTIGTDDLSATESGCAATSDVKNSFLNRWMGFEFFDKLVAPSPHNVT